MSASLGQRWADLHIYLALATRNMIGRLRGLNDVDLIVANNTGKGDLRVEEGHFIESCEQELMQTSSSEGISQISFSAVVARYCRHATGKVARGTACIETLVLFQDLPWALQVRFAVDITDRPCASSDPVPLLLCLDELNDGGELFHVGADAVPNICSDLFALMISTELLTVNDTSSVLHSTTSAPIDTSVNSSKGPSPAPVASHSWNPIPTDVSTGSTHSNQTTTASSIDRSAPRTDELSLVLGLGLTMSAIFVLALSSRIICRFQRRKLKPSLNRYALQSDESVSSENSHEHSIALADSMQLTIVTGSVHDDGSVSSISSRFGISSTSKSASSIGSRGRKTATIDTSYRKSKRSHSAGWLVTLTRDPPGTKYDESIDTEGKARATKRRSSFPQLLLTENLSDDNPVHIRKRFSHRRGSSFTFDETDINRSTALTQWTDGKLKSSHYIHQSTQAIRAPDISPLCTTTASSHTAWTVNNKENTVDNPVERSAETHKVHTADRLIHADRKVANSALVVLGQRNSNVAKV